MSINILLSCNLQYVFPANVLLNSIVVNHPEVNIAFWIMHDKRNDLIGCFSSVCANENVRIYDIGVDASVFNEMPIPVQYNSHISIEAYFRLLLLDYIPDDIERILYLDVDTICNKSLSLIYNVDMGNFQIAACEDYGFVLRPDIRKKVYDNLNFDDHAPYYNSGVILFNLKEIRAHHRTRDFFEFMEKNEKKILFHDQDVINYIFHGKILSLSIAANCRPFFFYNTKKQENKLLSKAYIIHYGHKPWKIDYIDTCLGVFWEYALQCNYKKEYGEFYENRKTYLQKNRWQVWKNQLKHNLFIYINRLKFPSDIVRW